ncbi:AP-like endonuclease reverse transcriptase [Brachionus plicatilis]|uniref:AP-like endonuclease reverse transcriptase n=1 Tax=Brachionus plicatilis TaxID=10195 RepID=A0A3M7PMC3_BRAPC|nr:AP-like endonuclease reverse transcriptase [Brachionus plicatilis]
MALKRLKNEAASGPDQIHNLINSLKEIIELFNLSLRESRVFQAWKTSNITLIQKKASSLQDPLNYRPISTTSCLGKLLERIVYSRLYNFLEQNSLLIQEQSGFRKHRRTSVRIVRHILSRFGCLNRCEVFEGTSVRSCCDKQPCLLFLFGKGSVRSSEGFVVDMT